MIRDILHVASPGMRPRWVGRTKPMTADETAILILALVEGRALYKAGFSLFGEKTYYLLKSLERQGALDHAGYNDWRITEKGRIAAALAMTKDPQLAAAMEPEKTEP